MTKAPTQKCNIVEATTADQISDAKKLFREYEAGLGLDLCFQGFEGELAQLPGKYASPNGRLYLAFVGEEAAGCIGLRKLDVGICEMKRLFVRDEFRGLGIGISLIESVIAAAREIGYRSMRLDTYPPKMGKAVILYTALGFQRIEPYYDNPHDDTVFMELAL